MCSCSLLFFFFSLIFTFVPAGSSHFLTVAITLSCFSSNEIYLLFFFFLSLALAPSSLSTSVDVEINFSRKEDSALLLFFSP